MAAPAVPSAHGHPHPHAPPPAYQDQYRAVDFWLFGCWPSPSACVMADDQLMKRFRACSELLCERWVDANAPSKWEGVKFRDSDGRVTSIKILGTNRAHCPYTAIPSMVGLLTGLQSLELNWLNKLTMLPEEIGHLTSLVTLNLTGCFVLAKLPDAIGRLAALTTLDLSGCRSLKAINPAVGKLTSLRTLKMINICFVERLPAELGALASLRTLNLSGMEQLEAIPLEFGQLAEVTSLHMDGCTALTVPPAHMVGQPADVIIGFLAAFLIAQPGAMIVQVRASGCF